MKLLIIGATGATGREIVSQALTQGHAVTALVRDSGKANFAQHVEKAVGNVLEPGTLEKVLTGQEAVICSLGSAATGPFKEMTMLSQGTRNLVAAMKSQRVSRLICITSIGDYNSSQFIKALPPTHLHMKDICLDSLITSFLLSFPLKYYLLR